MKGKIIKTLLLSLAMFIAGYLTAVYSLDKDGAAEGKNQNLTESIENISSTVKSAASEHGEQALRMMRDRINKMLEEKDGQSVQAGSEESSETSETSNNKNETP
ncbi:hypothetical protein L21SP3_02246 [Sedimentisphaera cyanobacteriorum]|uniref:Uncharacterized protein n=1 Tax=Sedimentisphaera cyanobacteriorum TaxID=1940790 RepID=A0A1Q2HSY5_9BACT|nr:hypothetical protein [Sedimentisphaera cyanobacteriorum]AQQ10414.1 hypothetical protein L21SP3_02246 [Sedimentisphaera cyanobacteriorum]